MTRVSTDLPPDMWGGLDRWAEVHGVTRSEAVREAVKRLVEAHTDEIRGLGQMGVMHPDLAPPRSPR
jgi:metal-responsive CopG/Arc/MetJ family transcriptional regulator